MTCFQQEETQPKHRILTFPDLGEAQMLNSDPKLALLQKAEWKPQVSMQALKSQGEDRGLTPSPAWWFLISCRNVTFQKNSSWGGKGFIARTQWDVPFHLPWIICDNTLAGFWKHRRKKKDERKLESMLSPVIARALKMPKDLFDCTLFGPHAIFLLLIHVLERSLMFCWKYISLLAKCKGIFSRKKKAEIIKLLFFFFSSNDPFLWVEKSRHFMRKFRVN